MTNPGPTVVVSCSDESHEGRTAYVARFCRDDTRPQKEPWFEWPMGSVKHGGGHARSSRQNLLPGDQPAPERAGILGGFVEVGQRFRIRYDLRCELCSLPVPVRAEKLYPILDRLASARVDSIELAHLAAIVSNYRPDA